MLPALSSRLSELENQNDELREKNRQMEQKLATMQVILVILVHPSVMFLCLNLLSMCPGDAPYISLIRRNCDQQILDEFIEIHWSPYSVIYKSRY